MDNSLEKAGCHIENVGELLKEVGAFADPLDNGTIKIPADKIPVLAGKIWLKLEETFRECEGKEIKIEFGDTAGATLAENAIVIILEHLKKLANENRA